MARPQMEIDEQLVQKLARLHCSNTEIASVVGCSVDTLSRRFADVIAKGRDEGRISLRRKQWELAMAGDRSMCIWLGKQLLGQTERQEVTGSNGAALTFVQIAKEALALPEE